jgi:hypothetical protein
VVVFDGDTVSSPVGNEPTGIAGPSSGPSSLSTEIYTPFTLVEDQRSCADSPMRIVLGVAVMLTVGSGFCVFIGSCEFETAAGEAEFALKALIGTTIVWFVNSHTIKPPVTVTSTAPKNVCEKGTRPMRR